MLESVIGVTLLRPTVTCESGTNWTCGVTAAAWRAWVTAVLIAAIIAGVSCPSPLGPGRADNNHHHQLLKRQFRL